tara:strand:- start:68 stop:493 length:426 start_codon:yes stop_codon:yes gene_type:complete
MKLLYVTEIILICFAISSSLVAEKISVQTLPLKELENCINSSNGNDQFMRECLAEETEKWDKRLNTAYQELKSLMPPDVFAELKQGQLSWIKYKQKTCDYAFDSAGGGTASFVVANNCILNLTIPRALELEELVRFWQPPA